MILKSLNRKWFGREVAFGNGVKVSFDRLGKAEIDDEKGKEIVDVYAGLVCEEGKEPEKEIDPVVRDDSEFASSMKARVEELTSEVETQKGIVDAKKKKLASVEAEAKTWREKAGELISENEKLKSQVKEEKNAGSEGVEDFKFQIELLRQETKEIKKLAIDMDIQEADLKNKKRVEVVDMILKKVAEDAKN